MSPSSVRYLPAFVLSAAFGVALPASADSPAQQAMEQNFLVSKVASMKSESTMVLVSSDGQKRERRMESLSKLQPNGIDSKLIVRFEHPADIRGTSFLQVERFEGEDDLWIYLPALKKSRRLVSSNKKESFLGSDFSYGDLLPPQVAQYEHRLLRVETFEGVECSVVESVPKSDKVSAESGYGRKITWVRKDSGLEAKVEYYDLAGQLLKVQVVRKPRLVDPAKGRWIAEEREMSNQQTGHKTVLTFNRVEPRVAIADDQFSVRTLESK